MIVVVDGASSTGGAGAISGAGPRHYGSPISLRQSAALMHVIWNAGAPHVSLLGRAFDVFEWAMETLCRLGILSHWIARNWDQTSATFLAWRGG